MPMHDYKCESCGSEVVVLRSFAEHDKLPTKEDIAQQTLPQPICDPDNLDVEHVWVKVVPKNTSWVRNWSGKKGSWLHWFVLGVCLCSQLQNWLA